MRSEWIPVGDHKRGVGNKMYRKKYFSYSFQPDTPMYVLDGVRVDSNPEIVGIRVEHGFLKEGLDLIVLNHIQSVQLCRNVQLFPTFVKGHQITMQLLAEDEGLSPYIKIRFNYGEKEMVFEEKTLEPWSFTVPEHYDSYQIVICAGGSGRATLKQLIMKDQSAMGHLVAGDKAICSDVWGKEIGTATQERGLLTLYEWQEDQTPDYEWGMSEDSCHLLHISSPNYFEHYYQREDQIAAIAKEVEGMVSATSLKELTIYGRGTTAIAALNVAKAVSETVPVTVFLENPIFNLTAYLKENPFDARFRGYQNYFKETMVDVTNRSITLHIIEEQQRERSVRIANNQITEQIVRSSIFGNELRGMIRTLIHEKTQPIEAKEKEQVAEHDTMDNKN